MLDAQAVDGAPAAQRSATTGMVGDVNIFLNDDERPHAGEVEIMIAGTNEPPKRGAV